MPDRNGGSPSPAWIREIIGRMRQRFVLKAVGTTIFISVFFVAYFYVLRHPAYESTLMPLTALDLMIPFQPGALIIYLSLWFYVGIPATLLTGLRELIMYCCWTAALCITGLACFYFWPTTIPRGTIDTEANPGFQLIQGLDAAGNACPSLHVATAIYSAIWLHRLLREIGAGRFILFANWCWVASIAFSTLATKQHVALDVLAGVALGAGFALASLWPGMPLAIPRPALSPRAPNPS
jgi:membrane-associated phospholipid phosphatase